MKRTLIEKWSYLCGFATIVALGWIFLAPAPAFAGPPDELSGGCIDESDRALVRIFRNDCDDAATAMNLYNVGIARRCNPSDPVVSDGMEVPACGRDCGDLGKVNYVCLGAPGINLPF